MGGASSTGRWWWPHCRRPRCGGCVAGPCRCCPRPMWWCPRRHPHCPIPAHCGGGGGAPAAAVPARCGGGGGAAPAAAVAATEVVVVVVLPSLLPSLLLRCWWWCPCCRPCHGGFLICYLHFIATSHQFHMPFLPICLFNSAVLH